jgi:hypothetical protein
MVLNTTFNNISVISGWSVLLVEETRVLREDNPPATCNQQTSSHNVVSSTCEGFELTTLEVIGTVGICSCKSNYHMIMTTAPRIGWNQYHTS